MRHPSTELYESMGHEVVWMHTFGKVGERLFEQIRKSIVQKCVERKREREKSGIQASGF